MAWEGTFVSLVVLCSIGLSIAANPALHVPTRMSGPAEKSKNLQLRGGSIDLPQSSDGPTVPVNFEVAAHHIRPKSGPLVKVLLVGNLPEIGEWNPDKGVELTCANDEFPIFKGSVALPPGSKLEYKYVVARKEKTSQGVQSQWEASNRQYAVGQSGGVVRNTFIENRESDPRIIDEPFQLSSQEWTRWFKHHTVS
eukprot:CAMPEP_0113695252 /NCGR_PEP_ID=MMETSP0038_2-20120614/20792_1 /TAXON_ID=2898 /ORGANISM="Cryptomonas paramecium" /LENGTH=195 /DNA_ID=CAMNT_0000617765 /DNA_START=25 /DNA_END=612 /DNA_ORIENTATION=+ /assembly_acc=CAM_ASM_000170